MQISSKRAAGKRSAPCVSVSHRALCQVPPQVMDGAPTHAPTENLTPTDTLRHHTGHRTGQLGHPGHHRTPLDTPDTPDTSKPDTPDTPDRHTHGCVQNPFGHSGHQTGHSPDTLDTIPGHPPDTPDTRTGHPPDTSRTPPDTRTPRTPRAQPDPPHPSRQRNWLARSAILLRRFYERVSLPAHHRRNDSYTTPSKIPGATSSAARAR